MNTPPLRQHDQRRIGFYRRALRNNDLCNRTIVRCQNLVFHFHGFQNDQQLSSLDLIALLDLDTDNVCLLYTSDAADEL